jgi:2-polyprenyl-3-methyl-5-hydroxy-6-metoxy-1,4-benzoquinol methylase
MKTLIREQTVGQDRWNLYGASTREAIEERPEKYVLEAFPYHPWHDHDRYDKAISLLSPLRNKRILELGCGLGKLSVWLAQQGAHVTGVDIGRDLIASARTLAEVNHVDCDFRCESVTTLRFADPGTYDAALGIAVLHHLSAADVKTALRECHRVLKPGGRAVFCESVENSELFNLVQNLVPIPARGATRPSILQRRAWKAYVESLDDRDMTNQELILAGEGLFTGVRVWSYGFLIRLADLFGSFQRRVRVGKILVAADRFLLRLLPPLRHFCQVAVVEYQK